VAGDRLTALVAAITGAPVAEITEESSLVADLGLTSIGRLELVNALEQEFRLDLDDALIGPETRMRDLRQVVSRRDRILQQRRFRPWANSPPVRLIRQLCDHLIHFPLLRLCCPEVEISGVERLANMQQPVLFIANHVSYLDQPVIMRALPPQWRYNTATAVWAEFFFRNFRNLFQKLWKRFTYDYGTFALNLFPLPQSQGFRSSLVYMGSLVDRGINLLVFPEGERSFDGKLLPFKQGLGIMAQELDIPVVPVRIRGLETVFPRGASWPKRGPVSVTIGEPLRFGLENPKEIVAIARKAIEEA
jgi:long-chain acyl-CoA synthetase